MKRISLLTIAFVLLLCNTYAQLITIGTGTATNSTTSGSPINIYYRSSHCQFVYTKAELNTAGLPGSAVMTKFGFFIAGSPLYALPNFTISMKHTTAVNPSVYDGTGLTVVKTIPSYLPVAGGWDTLALDTPFCWNGVDNILVDVCFDLVVPTWNSSGQVRIFNSANGFKFTRSDVSNQCGTPTVTTTTDKPQARMRFQNIGAPVANFTADTVCVNLPTTFSNSTVASCGTPTYSWDFAGLGTSTAVNPTFTFPSAGTYPVKLIATLGSQKDSITKNVIVKPRPTPTISTPNPNICIGDPITITTTATGGKKWYVNDTLHSIVGMSITYAPKFNDTIKLEETALNGCKAWSNIIIINRNPYPAKPNITKLTPATVVCLGDTVTLSSSSPTGNQWYIKSGTAYILQTGATGQTFKYPANGNFLASVEVTTPANCKKRSDDFLVTVTPTIFPIFGATPLTGTATQTVFFTNYTSGLPMGSTYKWYFGTGDSSSLQNPSYQYKNPGTYSVTLQITPPPGMGCKGTTVKNNYIIIQADTTASSVTNNLINESTVTISPNPANDNVNVIYTLNRAENITVVITDLNGKTYFSTQENQAPGVHSITCNTSELSAGVYMVRILSREQQIYKKLIITR
jgi:PKD repeat protein